MKKLLVLAVVVGMLASTAFGYMENGGVALGKDNKSIGVKYITPGIIGAEYQMAIDNKMGMFAGYSGYNYSLLGYSVSISAFSGGAYYNFLNEQKGDSFSLSGSAGLAYASVSVMGYSAGGFGFTGGLGLSKKVADKLYAISDIGLGSFGGASQSSIGIGAAYDLSKDSAVKVVIGLGSATGFGVGYNMNL